MDALGQKLGRGETKLFQTTCREMLLPVMSCSFVERLQPAWKFTYLTSM
jgi:hypothetical protein